MVAASTKPRRVLGWFAELGKSITYGVELPPNSFSDHTQFSVKLHPKAFLVTSSMFRLAAQRQIANKLAGSSRGISSSTALFTFYLNLFSKL